MAAKDPANITGGPAEILLADTAVSLTQGGVTITVTPEQRRRVVDKYGNSAVDLIHNGESVRVQAPLPEWTKEVMLAAYDPGADKTEVTGGDTYLGIGRTAGYIYTTQDLKVVPLLSANEDKCAQFYRSAPVGELSIVHNNEDDRVFNAEYECLVDHSKDDGELIGKLFLTKAA